MAALGWDFPLAVPLSCSCLDRVILCDTVPIWVGMSLCSLYLPLLESSTSAISGVHCLLAISLVSVRKGSLRGMKERARSPPITGGAARIVERYRGAKGASSYH